MAITLYVSEVTRPFVKWVLRRTTGLCELQRTCYCEPSGASRVIGIENSLRKSKSEKIKKLLEFLDRAASEHRFSSPASNTIVKNSIDAVCSIKCIRPNVHQPFGKAFGECVAIIWGYKQLLHELEILRTTAYDSSNLDHEEKLLELWSNLMPERKLEARVSEDWKDIGFQGEDPKTDFRGMGMLGLENLLHFASCHSDVARHVLSHSNHPQHGYFFAIVGINLTHLAFNLWKDGSAKSHVYNACCHHSCYETFLALTLYLCYTSLRFNLAMEINVLNIAILYEIFRCVALDLLQKISIILAILIILLFCCAEVG
nr:EOG090X0AMT [Macrothrix elegans]